MATATELHVNIDPTHLIKYDTTIWVSCPKQSTGYLVGIDSLGIEIVTDVRDWNVFTTNQKRAVRLWMNRVYQLHDYNNPDVVNFDQCCTLGSWYDEGILYLDTCNWYNNLEAAMKAAKQYKQLAILDVANNEVISCK